jgi:chaperonin GroES
MKFVYSAIVLMALEGARGFTSIAAKSPNTQLNLMIDGTKVGGEVKAANNFILVKVADAIDKSEGGILFADSAKVQKTQGTVVSVGPGKTHPETGETFEIPVKAGEGLVYGLTLESANVIRDAVLVYVEQKESETEGGLYLTKSSDSENKQSTGRVVKVGPGLFGDMEVAPGDNIKFREYFGNEVELDGEEYSVVRMGDILAKF